MRFVWPWYWHSRERCYEYGKHFNNLETTNPKDILQEEETFFKTLYTPNGTDPNLSGFNPFFEVDNVLSHEMAETCGGCSIHWRVR